MTKQKTISLIIIIGILCFAFGFYLGSAKKPVVDKNNTFEAGWQAAKKRLKETGFSPPIGEITSLSGKVEKIEGNKIFLKIHPLDPLADPKLDTRIVEVGKETKIYQLIEKDPEQFQREEKEFERKMREQMREQMENPEKTKEPINPPTPFTKKETDFSKIKIGQEIVVKAKEDIKETKQFRVSEIEIQPAK